MRFVGNIEHYNEIVLEGILKAVNRVWIATANVKNLHVPGGRRTSLPLLCHFEKMQRRGVTIRILHGTKPSAPFRNTLAELSELHHGDGFEMQLCPRVHSKIVIIDNRLAYTGSANLTGAGIGAKSDRKRNFENGVITENPTEILELESYFDNIWMGLYCKKCGRKDVCPNPLI